VAKSPKSRNQREVALARLKLKWELDNEGEEWAPEREVKITPLLKAVDGGIPRVLDALRAHDDEDARDFIELYDSLTATDRGLLKLEEIALASGIGALRLVEVANSALILHSKLTTSLLLVSNMHRVVSTSIKEAVKPKGLADREWMLKAGGILPVPKGAQIAIQTNVTPERSETKAIEGAPVVEYLDASQRLRMIHDAVEQRRLPSPQTEPVELGGKIDHLQAETAAVISGGR